MYAHMHTETAVRNSSVILSCLYSIAVMLTPPTYVRKILIICQLSYAGPVVRLFCRSLLKQKIKVNFDFFLIARIRD